MPHFYSLEAILKECSSSIKNALLFEIPLLSKKSVDIYASRIRRIKNRNFFLIISDGKATIQPLFRYTFIVYTRLILKLPFAIQVPATNKTDFIILSDEKFSLPTWKETISSTSLYTNPYYISIPVRKLFNQNRHYIIQLVESRIPRP